MNGAPKAENSARCEAAEQLERLNLKGQPPPPCAALQGAATLDTLCVALHIHFATVVTSGWGG